MRESDRRRHQPIQLAHLGVIAVENLEEAGLRARRPLHAAAWQGRNAVVEVREVEHEVLHPQRSALADSCRLRRLEVGVAERRFCSPLSRKRRQCTQHPQQPPAKQAKAAAHENQVGVVGDEGARRTEVNELVRRGRDVAKGVHVGHDVMSKAPLVHGNALKVDVVEVGAHLVKRRIRNVHAELLLCLGQRQPEPAPKSMAHLRGPQLEHRPGGIALGERGRVAVIRRHRITKSMGKVWPSRSQIRRIGPRPA